MLDEAALAEAIVDLERTLGLEALWLFGSEGRREARPDSDVDLGALLPPGTDPLAVLDARARVEARLGRAVDLVDLRRASPVLAMQVVRTGRLVHERDAARRVAFQAGLPGRYEEVERMRAPMNRALLERLAHGRP